MVMEHSVLTLARWQGDDRIPGELGGWPQPGPRCPLCQLSTLAAPHTPSPLGGPQGEAEASRAQSLHPWPGPAPLPGTRLLTGGAPKACASTSAILRGMSGSRQRRRGEWRGRGGHQEWHLGTDRPGQREAGGRGGGLDLGCQAGVGAPSPGLVSEVGLGEGSVWGRGAVPLEVMPPMSLHPGGTHPHPHWVSPHLEAQLVSALWRQLNSAPGQGLASPSGSALLGLTGDTCTHAHLRAHVYTHTHTPCRLSPDGAETDCLDLRPRSAPGTQGIPVNLDVFSAPHLRAVARCPGPTPQSRGSWGQGGPHLGCRGPHVATPHLPQVWGTPTVPLVPNTDGWAARKNLRPGGSPTLSPVPSSAL